MLYNILETTHKKDGNKYRKDTKEYTVTTARTLDGFNKDLNPRFVAIDIENQNKAYSLVLYFSRDKADFFESLRKPPFVYKEPTIISQDVTL